MKNKMTSKQALEELYVDIKQFEEHFIGCICFDSEEEYNLIKKDLEILECFRKIPKQDFKNFIDEQIRYEINLNSWLKSCNCDLEKEELTKHLIKIKEWLEKETK